LAFLSRKPWDKSVWGKGRSVRQLIYATESWEGDLLSSSKNTHIATLVERSSRFAMLVKVNGKDSDNVVGALIRHAIPAARANGLVDLGSGDGDGLPSEVHLRDGRQRLLL
jgi:hypothetical protein